MNVAFEACFARDLKRLRNESLLRQVQQIIEQVKAAPKLSDIHNLKKRGMKLSIGCGWETTA